MKKYKVSVVKCSSYSSKKVREALLSCFNNIGFSFNSLKPGSKILIKPNILAPHKPEKAITTHPVVLEELCRILKKHKFEIYIGESSSNSTDKSFAVSGIAKLSKYGEIINFENQEKLFIEIEGLKTKKPLKIPLPKILFDADLIINVAKLKTHGLTQVTLCTKNLYGCVPGQLKSRFHKEFPSPKEFSKMLFNVSRKINPELNIIDGIVGMEGEGPALSGRPVKSEILVMSKNASAADIVASEIIGLDPYSIYTNKFSGIKKETIEVTGDAKNTRLNFAKPKISMIPFLPLLQRFIPQPKIKFNYDKCKQCHLCEKKCPVNAINLGPWPKCTHGKCISCLCCIEVCPHDAVYLEEPAARRMLKSVYKKFLSKNS